MIMPDKKETRTADKLCLAVVVACLVILTCSCGSSKNTNLEKQVDYSGYLHGLRASFDSLKLDIRRQTKITTDKLSNMELSNTTVYYSRPDSTGRQYPVKESTTNLNKEDRERHQSDETLFVSLRYLSERMDSLDAKLDILLNEKEKVEELSWWDLHKDKACLFIIAAISIGWVALGNNFKEEMKEIELTNLVGLYVSSG